MTRQEFIELFSKPDYIGDSVYVHFDGYQIILETHNGLQGDPSNRIALEPEVMLGLKRYEKRLIAAAELIE